MPQIKALFAIFKNPLQHLSRYFHTGEGKNLKYSKLARQAICAIQEWKYQIGDLFDTIFEISFDLIITLIKAIGFLFKCTFLLIMTIMCLGIAIGIGYGFEELRVFMEMPRWVGYATLVAFIYGLSYMVSVLQSLVWFNTEYVRPHHLQRFLPTNLGLLMCTTFLAISIAPK